MCISSMSTLAAVLIDLSTLFCFAPSSAVGMLFGSLHPLLSLSARRPAVAVGTYIGLCRRMANVGR